MFTLTTVGAVTLACIAIICVEQYLKNSRFRFRSYPLPPGPSGLPWIGNVFGLDAGAPWLTYSKWAKTYGQLRLVGFDSIHSVAYIYVGDLIYTRLFGREIIIINSEKVARELLELRSRNYSDRPYLITTELWVL